MRWLVLFALVGCGDSLPGIDAAPPPFTLHVDLFWSVSNSPDVTGVTVDGAPLASATHYTLDETYASYADAVRSFSPRSVVEMTGSGSVTTLMQMYTCGSVSQDELKQLGRLIGESDTYVIDPRGLEWDQGTCKGVDGTVGAITRRARTR